MSLLISNPLFCIYRATHGSEMERSEIELSACADEARSTVVR